MQEQIQNLMSLKEAEEYTPYSAEYLNLLVRKKKLKAIKIGRDWLVSKEDLFDYLRVQQGESQSKLTKLNRYINLLM